MTEVSMSAMDNFAKQGGMVGMAYFSLVVLFLIALYGFYWYVKSQRAHDATMSGLRAEQYDKRLAVEKQLADAMHELSLSIKGRPCMRGDTDRLPGQTRRHD